MLSLNAICVNAVGRDWDTLALHDREALPPVLQQLIFKFMVKNDLVVDRDITPILPALIRTDSGSTSRFNQRTTSDDDQSFEASTKDISDAQLLPSLDLCCKTVSERTISQIASVCPDLQEVILKGSTTVTDSLFSSLFDQLPSLRSVQLTPAYLLTDLALMALTPAIRERLQVLVLHRNQRISLGALLSLVEDCHNMKELTFQTFIPNTQMNDELVLKIARAKMNTTLTSLMLSDCSFVTDEAVEKVIKHCKNLEVLRIGMAIKMQGTCFERFMPTNCGATLRVLDFNNRTIPGKTLMHIAEVCTRLQTLGLANAPEPIDYEALKQLLKGCPSLKDLSVTVGPEAAQLDCFANLPNLRYLYLILFHVGGDEEVYLKDEAIDTLADGCPGLESLCIRGATDNALPILVQKLPRLRSLSLFVTHLSGKQRLKRKQIGEKVKGLKSARARALTKGPKTVQTKLESQFAELETALIDMDKQMREKEKEREEKEKAIEKEKDKKKNGKHSNGFASPIMGSPSQGGVVENNLTSSGKRKRKRGQFVCTDLDTFSLSGSNITSSEVRLLLQDYYEKGDVRARGAGFTKISFTDCCKVGDAVMESISVLFGHSVETLAFYKCGLVTDKGLSYISNCGRLESLDVRGCVLVGSKGIVKVLRKCKNLETIFLPKNSLTAEERGQLRRSFPHVRVTLSSQ